MIQPTALGSVNKVVPSKTQGTEASTGTSFDLLLQIANGGAAEVQNTPKEMDGLVDALSPFLMANQLVNLAMPENPSTDGTESQDKEGAQGQLLMLKQTEPLVPQNGKQWDLSVLHKLTNTFGPNGNSALMDELQKVIDEKVGQGTVEVGLTDDSLSALGQQDSEQKPNVHVVLQKEASLKAGNPPQNYDLQAEQLQVDLLKEKPLQAGGNGQAETENDAVFPQTDIEAAADMEIPTTESRPSHSLQPILGGDVPAIRANHFAQDMKQFFQSTLQQAAPEGMDGMKPAVSFQKLVDGTEAIIKLSPEHLGDIEVKVKIQDGQIKAEFLASTHQGKDLLETHVHALRSALEVQGLQVGKIDISQQSGTSFMGEFSQRGDANPRHGQQESRKRGDEKIPAQEKYQDYGLDSESHSQINTTA